MPVGVPPAPVTVAVNVTASPTVAGFGEEVSVVRVGFVVGSGGVGPGVLLLNRNVIVSRALVCHHQVKPAMSTEVSASQCVRQLSPRQRVTRLRL